MARLVVVLAIAQSAASMTVDTTAYSPCSSGSITATGTTPRNGTAAANWLPLGTIIKVWPPAFGRTHYTIDDRVGYGTSLDLYTTSCTAAIAYGRRLERVTILREHH